MLSIRGKRKQDVRKATKNSHQRQRGRPMKRINDLATPKTTVNAQLRKSHRTRQSHVTSADGCLSQLERLPNELIQHIFFECFEVNLPRSSWRLSQALSTESTYHALILFAFFDEDETHPVETELFLPAAYRTISIREKVRLQGNILSCRWCNLGRIRACLPALARLSMVQAWHREQSMQPDNETQAAIQTSSLAQGKPYLNTHRLLEDRALLPTIGDTTAMERHFMVREELRSPESLVYHDRYLPRIVEWESTLTEHKSGELSWHKYARWNESILAARMLPDCLVRGQPWTEKKLALLQLLRQGLQFIDQHYVLEVSVDAVFEGVSSAIQETHTEALLTLLELHEDVFRQRQSLHTRSSYRSNHPLPLYIYHLATRAGAKSSDIMWMLIRHSLDSVPSDDDVLTAWALKGQDRNDKVAGFLLDYMSGKFESQADPQGALFKRGKWCKADRHNKTFPPADLTFDEELGYLRGARDRIPTRLDGRECG